MDNYFIDDNTQNTVEIEDVSENIKMKSNKKNRNRVAINDELEIVQTGFANAVAEGFPLSENEKLDMINSAEHAFGMFLDALKCDWRNDPNSMDTPRRVAKA